MSALVRCPRCRCPRRVEVAGPAEVATLLGGFWAGPMPSFQCANGCGVFVVLGGSSRTLLGGKSPA